MPNSDGKHDIAITDELLLVVNNRDRDRQFPRFFNSWEGRAQFDLTN